ncbi:MAG: RNA polymerase sigma factor [Myxococcales bacterium]|jgi:RNA polymerase sigma-70 factor (ECF subfamily)
MQVVSDRDRVAGSRSDLGLMKLVAEGDAHAQRVLAHRLAPRVQRITGRLVANRADAEDAAQLALIEILRSAGSFREEASIERWADRITVRTTLRHARDQRKRFWSLGSRVDPDEVRAALVDPAQRGQTPRKLEEYLAELPEARREALVLKHGLGYTTEEIAELTGKPVGTVKDRLVAARRQLRKLIQRELRLGANRPARKGGGNHG